MNRNALASVLFIISISCHAQKSVTDTSFYPNGQIKEKSEFDKSTNKWTTKGYYINGAIQSIKMRDTALRLTDTYQVFYTNGHLAFSRTYDNNVLNGTFAEYYEFGQMKRAGHYYNNFKTGRWIEYFPNGIKKREGKYFLTAADSAMDMEKEFDLKKETMKGRICYDTISYPELVPKADAANSSGGDQKTEIYTVSPRTDVALTLCSLKNGVWKYWNEQGTLILEETYKEGTLIESKKD